MTNCLLHEFDRDEWRDVVRKVRPQMTDEEFDLEWAEFEAMKARKGLQ